MIQDRALVVAALSVLPSLLSGCSEKTNDPTPPSATEPSAPEVTVTEPTPTTTSQPDAPSINLPDIPTWLSDTSNDAGTWFSELGTDSKLKWDEAVLFSSDQALFLSEETAKLAKTVADDSTKLAKDMLEKSKVFGLELQTQTVKIGEQSVRVSSEVWNRSRDLTTELGSKAEEILKEAARGSKDLVLVSSEELTRLGIPKDVQQRMVHVGVDLIPIAGATVRFYEARTAFKAAGEDLVKQEEAKTLCLVALADLGIDIGALGTADGVNALAQTLESLQLVSMAGSISELDVDALKPVAKELLKLNYVDQACVYLLSVEHPDTVLKYLFERPDPGAKDGQPIVPTK